MYKRAQPLTIKSSATIAVVLLTAIPFVQARPQSTLSRSKPELILQTGHSQVVTGIDFSPDSDAIASASTDGTVKLWNVRDGHLLQTIDERDSEHLDAARLSNVAFRFDRKGVFTGIYTTDWRGVELRTSERTQQIRLPGVPQGALAIDPRGRWIAVSSGSGSISILDPSDLHSLWFFDAGPDAILTLAVSPDGTQLASGGSDNNITLWDTLHGKNLGTLRGHTDYVRSLAFSQEGQTLVSGSDDRTIRVWNVATGQCVKTFPAAKEVQSVATTRDGRLIASVEESSQVRLLDSLTGQVLKTFAAMGNERFIDFQNKSKHIVRWFPGAIAFSPDDRLLAVSGQGGIGIIDIWDVRSLSRVLTLGRGTEIRSAKFSPKGRYLEVCSSSEMQLFDLGLGTPAVSPLPGNVCPNFSPDESSLTAFVADALRTWKVGSVVTIQSFPASRQFRTVTYSLDDTLFAGATLQGTVEVWKVATGDVIQTITIELNRGVPVLRFHPNGKWLITASSRGDYISVWDVNSGRQVKKIDCLAPVQLIQALQQVQGASGPCGVRGIAVEESTGNLAATGIFGARLWSGPKWKNAQQRIDGRIEKDTALSPGGRYWAAGKSVWDLEKNREFFDLGVHDDAPAFSADSRWLVTIGKGELALWDAKSGQLAAIVTLLPGGDWLVTTPDGLFDGTERAWANLLWRFGNGLGDVLPVEAYFRDFYHPGLLADIISGKQPKAPRDIAAIDERSRR